MILHVYTTAHAASPLLRGMLCGRVYVKWPYLQEADAGVLEVGVIGVRGPRGGGGSLGIGSGR